MGIEIERKFLVNPTALPFPAVHILTHGSILFQAYLSVDPVVRIRRESGRGRHTLTVKGPRSSENPTTCVECEYDISERDFEQMMPLAVRRVTKARLRIPSVSGLHWDLDLFFLRHPMFLLAEAEVPTRDHPVPLPEWIGKEVTGDPGYDNVNLKDDFQFP